MCISVNPASGEKKAMGSDKKSIKSMSCYKQYVDLIKKCNNPSTFNDLRISKSKHRANVYFQFELETIFFHRQIDSLAATKHRNHNPADFMQRCYTALDVRRPGN